MLNAILLTYIFYHFAQEFFNHTGFSSAENCLTAILARRLSVKFSRDYQPKEGNCFVLMPIGIKTLPDGSSFNWDEHYQLAIAPVVARVGMTPARADEIYGAQPQMEKIWKGIQEAEVIIADITGRDPNVLYELGLAHVIRKSVILITMNQSDVPSDLSGSSQIYYSIKGLDMIRFTQELEKCLTAARTEPKDEAALIPLPGSSIEKTQAKIITITPDFAIVETVDGRKGFLYAEDASWTRRNIDLTKLHEVGETLNGAFVSSGPRGEQRYSLKAVEENPWPRLEAKYPLGKDFTASIANATNAGIFVKMDFGINGFIPKRNLPREEAFLKGEEIRVNVLKIDAATRTVDLQFIRRVIGPTPPPDDTGPIPPTWIYKSGDQYDGTVESVRVDRGFILIRLSDNFVAMLNIRNMSDNLRRQFEANLLQVGVSIRTEVVQSDAIHRRLYLKDI